MKRATIAVLMFCTSAVFAQTQPTTTVSPTTRTVISSTTRPSQLSAEEMLRQMLQPANQGSAPLKPVPNEPPPVDATSGTAAVAPRASTQPTQPDGSPFYDRVGRITRTADGKFLEFTLDSDSGPMTDPPMYLLPNHELQMLEDLVNNSYTDMKVRVSGEITEYRGRNYLLILQWTQVQDVTQPLK
jgi:hypothetical protein